MAGIRTGNQIYEVGIYCRLSKDDGTENESASIATQKSILTDYVKKQGWHLAKTYVDDGYSGTNFQRPSFQNMIKDIENGRINCVITKDLSRLGRKDVYKRQERNMAYNHGREDRKWRIWKEAEEKMLRECGVDEAVIEQIRIEDRADFNSNRRFYRWTSDFGEYLEGMADTEPQAEPNTIADLLDEIENEKLYQALLTVDKHTLLILLLKMQGYSTREIAAMAGLTERAVYKRLERLRKKLKPIFYPFGEI